MTTIAVKGGEMACDSYVTGGLKCAATKIRRKNGIIVGYSGDWIAGEHIARCYLNDKKPDVDSDDDMELIVLKSSGIYLVDKKLREVKVSLKHYAIGSGSEAAMVAMNLGLSAPEAIKEAIKVNDFTGGRVRTLSLD
jgi:hypothetical protein